MKYYINYSDENFLTQQKHALKMAFSHGGFDEATGYSKDDIDPTFYKKYKHILTQKRGGGYWLWKPYFINKKLHEIQEGDYLFYSDSGAFFLKNVDLLIKKLEKSNQDIMAFENPYIEKQWTKKELFINMDCNTEDIRESNQIRSGLILIKKSSFSISFFEEYLFYATSGENLTDKLDVNIMQNADFIEHRHDQSVLSLLYKKYKLKPFIDPTQTFFPYILFNNIKNKKINIRIKHYRLKPELIIFVNRGKDPILSYMEYKEKYNNFLFLFKEYMKFYAKKLISKYAYK